jgi:hypothetical protein
MHGGGAENPIPIWNSNSNLKIKFQISNGGDAAGLSIGESTLTNVAPPPIKVSSPNLISGHKRSAVLAHSCDLPK